MMKNHVNLRGKLAKCRPKDWPVRWLLGKQIRSMKSSAGRRERRRKNRQTAAPAVNVGASRENGDESQQSRDGACSPGLDTCQPVGQPGPHVGPGEITRLSSFVDEQPPVPTVEDVVAGFLQPGPDVTASLPSVHVEGTGRGMMTGDDLHEPCTRVTSSGAGPPRTNRASLARNRRNRLSDDSEESEDSPSILFDDVRPDDIEAGIYTLYGPNHRRTTCGDWNSHESPVARALVAPPSRTLHGASAPVGHRVVTIVELSPNPGMAKFDVPFQSVYKRGPPGQIRGNLASLVHGGIAKEFFWATSLIYRPKQVAIGSNRVDWKSSQVAESLLPQDSLHVPKRAHARII